MIGDQRFNVIMKEQVLLSFQLH